VRARLWRIGGWTVGIGLAAALGMLAVSRVAVGMIVAAPSPAGGAMTAPEDVAAVLEVERDGAVLRAWVFEPEGEPRGTVLCLHGIRDSKVAHVPTARRLAGLGLRAVVVDSRGHGESTGEWLSYGVHESEDLRAVADALDRRAELTEPLLVVGSSYGAATAIQYGALDPRVRGVVAIAPFASLREVVRAYQGWMLGPLAAIIPESRTDAMIDAAGEQARFDPDDACARCAAEQLRVPLLLVHGRADERIPWQHSAAIRDAAAGPVELRVIDGVGHLGIGRAPGVSEAVDAFLLARTAGP